MYKYVNINVLVVYLQVYYLNNTWFGLILSYNYTLLYYNYTLYSVISVNCEYT